MANCFVSNAALTACSLVLGETEHRLEDSPEFYRRDPDKLAGMKNIFGFDRRRTAGPDTTAADLCLQAAQLLLRGTNLSPAQIGAVVSVTQTPDYPAPGNAHVLHARLGLDKEAAAFDLAGGCSGFIHGLQVAAMLCSSGIERVLLVAGDTLSKKTGPRDYAAAPLFGDAGAAALVERRPGAGDMHFILRANGAGIPTLYIPAGGARLPASTETAKERPLEDGGMRSPEQFHMDGFGVFSFTMTEQPPLLRDILAFSKRTVDNVDLFILHQANRYIVDSIARKAGIPPEKAPSATFSHFGNLSAASIPGVLCGEASKILAGRKAHAVLQGFGIGLSWGACSLCLDNMLCIPPEVYTAP